MLKNLLIRLFPKKVADVTITITPGEGGLREMVGDVRRSLTVVPGRPATPPMHDAEYLVWRRDQRGQAQPSLWMLDPRKMSDWPQERDRTIAIVSLTEADRRMNFADIVAAHPCPTRGQFE
jgi:hypothetical protein